MIYKSELRDFSRIPDAMKQAQRWVCWVDDKTPINPNTLGNARSNDKNTWGTFGAAEAQIGKTARYMSNSNRWTSDIIQGVGFMLGDGWSGIDLDGGAAHGCGEIPQSVIDDFVNLGTYCEWSKSGGGFHLIGRYNGDPLRPCSFEHNKGTPDKYGVEVYSSGRYFAITGNIYGWSTQILDITGTLPALHEKHIAEPERKRLQDSAANLPRKVYSRGNRIDANFFRDNVISILSCVDPSIDGRNKWFAVIAALRDEGIPVEIADAWSRGDYWGSTPHNYKGTRDVVAAYNSARKGQGANGGYIVKLAQQATGWRPETVTDSYKPKTAAEDFKGLTVHTAQPAAVASDPQPAADAQTPVKAPESAKNALERFLLTTGNINYRPIATGFPGLDKMLNGGFDPGTMSIIVAEPGTGKTALVMMVSENMAKAGQPVMVFNLEMGEDQLIARSLSRLTAEIAGTIKDGYRNADKLCDFGAVSGKAVLYSNQWGLLKQKQRENIALAMNRFSEYAENLYIVTDPITQYEQIINAVTAFKAQTGKTPVVVVDYLQLLFSDGKTSAVYSAKDIILGLKQRIAREMQTAVIMISATGRDKIKKGKLDLQSAFGSSFIEYSADYQFGLEKIDPEELVYKEDEKPLLLSLVKGRMNKPNVKQGLLFNGAYSLCREIDEAKLKEIKRLVADAEREQRRISQNDSQGEESNAQPPKTSKKPV